MSKKLNAKGKENPRSYIDKLSQPIQSTKRHYADVRRITLSTVMRKKGWKSFQVGIDICQRIFIKTKDESGKRKASSFQPKDLCIAEDDNDRICQPPTEEKAQRDIDSML